MAVRLVNAPIGLFEIDGVLVLKTQYCTKHEGGTVTADCYIVDSGEYFWGGVESAEERNNLMVTPVDMPTLTPPNEPLTLEQLREMDGEPVWVVPIGMHEKDEPMWCVLENPMALIPGVDYWSWDFDGYGETWMAYRRPPEGDV